MGFYFGADPGGQNSFGVALLHEDGHVHAATVSSAREALDFIDVPIAACGIDAPLWWSQAPGGGRVADQWIRKQYGIASGTVQSVNSLRGAVLAQGLILAELVRQRFPTALITESHPKALLLAQAHSSDESFFAAYGVAFSGNEHERDAVIAAICAREGVTGRWTRDHAAERPPEERSRLFDALGAHYFWPE